MVLTNSCFLALKAKNKILLVLQTQFLLNGLIILSNLAGELKVSILQVPMALM